MAPWASQILHRRSRASDNLATKITFGGHKHRRRIKSEVTEDLVEVREGMSSVVLALGPSHTLREAATKMKEKGTGAALVFDDESPAPRIITERDVLIAIGSGKDPDEEKLADHMSESVISAAPEWSLEQAAQEMVSRGIRHLVVVDHGELVGVLSMRDIVRCWTTAGATSSMTPP
jgi:signal-transduction protein with cAMP-binding, CBS, and nucleotidyltransferase domain